MSALAGALVKNAGENIAINFVRSGNNVSDRHLVTNLTNWLRVAAACCVHNDRQRRLIEPSLMRCRAEQKHLDSVNNNFSVFFL